MRIFCKLDITALHEVRFKGSPFSCVWRERFYVSSAEAAHNLVLLTLVLAIGLG